MGFFEQLKEALGAGASRGAGPAAGAARSIVKDEMKKDFYKVQPVEESIDNAEKRNKFINIPEIKIQPWQMPTTSPYQKQALDVPEADALRAQIFANQRQQAAQNIQSQSQGALEAMKRRFAAIGGLGGGSMIKQQQILADKQAQALQGMNRDLSEQEAIARLQPMEQRAQAEAGRAFQAGESEKQRQFAGGLAGQDFEFKRALSEQDRQTKMRELEMAWDEFQIDKDIAQFNKRMAQIVTDQQAEAAEKGYGFNII